MAPGDLTIDQPGQHDLPRPSGPGSSAPSTTPGGEQVSAIVCSMYSGARVYFLVAGTGTAFTQLEASFVALP